MSQREWIWRGCKIRPAAEKVYTFCSGQLGSARPATNDNKINTPCRMLVIFSAPLWLVTPSRARVEATGESHFGGQHPQGSPLRYGARLADLCGLYGGRGHVRPSERRERGRALERKVASNRSKCNELDWAEVPSLSR